MKRWDTDRQWNLNWQCDKRPNRGVSLLELSIALGLSTLVLLMSTQLVGHLTHRHAVAVTTHELTQQASIALNFIRTHLQEAHTTTLTQAPNGALNQLRLSVGYGASEQVRTLSFSPVTDPDHRLMFGGISEVGQGHQEVARYLADVRLIPRGVGYEIVITTTDSISRTQVQVAPVVLRYTWFGF